ncbi:MAG: DUF3631 domain-containing protein [Proteobacteria bacterium]|nr:DUF3631 domain-containing protein [Pseudomonadota bacterium]
MSDNRNHPIQAASYEEAVQKRFKNRVEAGWNLAIYQYKNLDCHKQDNVLYIRVRLDPPADRKKELKKEIFPMHFRDDGLYDLSEPPELKGNPKPLYGLDLVQAYPDATIYLVEGEKCADALNGFFSKHGVFGQYIAVTSGGASIVDGIDYSPLKEKNLVLWGDNDEPGFRYIAGVTPHLEAQGCHVSVIDTKAIELQEKEDVVDWLERNPEASMEDLLALPIMPPGVKEVQPISSPVPVAIQRLATMNELEYEQNRKEMAKQLGIRTTVLDKAVNAQRAEQHRQSSVEGMFPEVEPWGEPVCPDSLLTEIAAYIEKFAVLSSRQSTAIALWLCFTWCVDYVDIAPILAITSPEKRCGKTTVLTLVDSLACRTLSCSNLSPAALFRAIEEWRPTLVIDEADTFLETNEELRGIINAGHTRNNAYVLRAVATNNDFKPKKFNVWGAKAIAKIGDLQDTLRDRSIVIELRRKLNTEHTEKLRHKCLEEAKIIQRKLRRFADDNAYKLPDQQPNIPDGLSARAQDNWEPLIAIAMLAGEEWRKRAVTAAIALSDVNSEPPSFGVRLLEDVRSIFADLGHARIPTSDLITRLCEDEEKPWSTFNRKGNITARELATLLKPFGISSNTIRIGYPGQTVKGYHLEDFQDAFGRYLPAVAPDSSNISVTASQVANIANYSVTDTENLTVKTVTSETPESLVIAGCDAVTDKRPIPEDLAYVEKYRMVIVEQDLHGGR